MANLTMQDFARFDPQSVHAGLRGRDDGRVARYNHYARSSGLESGEAPLEDVLCAYSASLLAGLVPQVAAARDAEVLSASKGAVQVVKEIAVTMAIASIVGMGALWWIFS